MADEMGLVLKAKGGRDDEAALTIRETSRHKTCVKLVSANYLRADFKTMILLPLRSPVKAAAFCTRDSPHKKKLREKIKSY